MHLVVIVFAVMILSSGVFVNSFKTSKFLEKENRVLSVVSTPEVKNGDIDSPPQVQVLSDYIFPGSSVIFASDTVLSLTSSDNTDKITDWYKAKIQDLGFSVKNTVKTKTNGEVKNVLKGAGNGSGVSIEITKSASESITHIAVEVSN